MPHSFHVLMAFMASIAFMAILGCRSTLILYCPSIIILGQVHVYVVKPKFSPQDKTLYGRSRMSVIPSLLTR